MRQAQLDDGTTLEFPDETPDHVMDAAVKKAIQGTPAKAAPPKYTAPDPTAGMSWRNPDLSNNTLVTGIGSGTVDVGNRLRQALSGAPSYAEPTATGESYDPMGMPIPGGTYGNKADIEAERSKNIAAVHSDIAEKRKLDEPLLNTGGGLTGHIAAKAAPALAAAFVPGANTYLGASVLGTTLGAMEPTAAGESTAKNMAIGGALGPVTQYIGSNVVPAVVRGAKALIEPFTSKGQDKIVARTLQSFTNSPEKAAAAIENAKPMVAGSNPTTAEVAQDAGLAQLQRSVQAGSPKVAQDMAERALDQNSARLAAMGDLTKHGGKLDSAIARRSDIGEKLYDKALQSNVTVDDGLKRLMARPSVRSALAKAEQIAAENGEKIMTKDLVAANGDVLLTGGKEIPVKGLHYIKMALDDVLDSAPTSGIGKSEQRAIEGTRKALLEWLDGASPAYKSARVRYEKASRPINREQVAEEITSRATRSAQPNVRGEPTLYPDSFAKTLKDGGEAIVKSATGRSGKLLNEVMTPAQMDVLNNIVGDMSRSVTARDLGRSVGSNTAQNLASQNLTRQVLGPLGASEAVSQNAIVRGLMRVPQFIAKTGEEDIQAKLARALVDPTEAARLLRMAINDPGTLDALRRSGARRALGATPQLVNSTQQ